MVSEIEVLIFQTWCLYFNCSEIGMNVPVCVKNHRAAGLRSSSHLSPLLKQSISLNLVATRKFVTMQKGKDILLSSLAAIVT